MPKAIPLGGVHQVEVVVAIGLSVVVVVVAVVVDLMASSMADLSVLFSLFSCISECHK